MTVTIAVAMILMVTETMIMAVIFFMTVGSVRPSGDSNYNDIGSSNNSGSGTDSYPAAMSVTAIVSR